jgi:hypothetical protein
MLKAYMNEIWGSGAPPELRGKELLVVTTTAGGESAYAREGRLGFTIEEVLTPLRASANYTGMKFSKPLAFFAASSDANALRGYQKALAARLRAKLISGAASVRPPAAKAALDVVKTCRRGGQTLPNNLYLLTARRKRLIS